MRHRPNNCDGATSGDVGELPEQFVDSLKVLFDILDTSRSGFVSYEHMARKWRELPTNNLPANFLECLRRVTPLSGMLTFERFLNGVRLSLYERKINANPQRNANLHRVRSEGKLHDICNDKRFFGDVSSKAGLIKNGCENQNYVSAHPAMGLNVIFPPEKFSKSSSSAFNNSNQWAQLKKRNEYRSQPDISSRNSDYFEAFELEKSKENRESCGRKPINFHQSPNGVHLARTNSSANYGIVMRPKKGKSTRAPLPPKVLAMTSGRENGAHHCGPEWRDSCVGGSLASSPSISSQYSTVEAKNGIDASRGRPMSMNSAASGCSSGLSDFQLRNSRISKYNNGQNSNCRDAESPQSTTPYAEELQPQVAKHEGLLSEEFGIVQKGMHTTQSLLKWFQSRLESLEKRKKMLDKGMVALDSAVHEQKLNFYRAQISELSRRMNALMLSSEHGFPSHQNMIANEPDTVTTVVRNQVRPISTVNARQTPLTSVAPIRVANGVAPSAGGSLGSSSVASSTRTTASAASSSQDSSSHNSSPEPKIFAHQKVGEIGVLKQQQQKLFEELDAKSRLIEKLQREKRISEIHQAQFFDVLPEKTIGTIRKPIIAGIGENQRRMLQNGGRKLINDTLL